MTLPVYVLIAILGILSLSQRVVPWLLYKRVKKGSFLQNLFDIIAVSAFASLMIDNIQALNVQNLIPLLPALIVAYKTKNLAATVLVALLVSLAFSFLWPP